jgi:hypothetical protein
LFYVSVSLQKRGCLEKEREKGGACKMEDGAGHGKILNFPKRAAHPSCTGRGLLMVFIPGMPLRY